MKLALTQPSFCFRTLCSSVEFLKLKLSVMFSRRQIGIAFSKLLRSISNKLSNTVVWKVVSKNWIRVKLSCWQWLHRCKCRNCGCVQLHNKLQLHRSNGVPLRLQSCDDEMSTAGKGPAQCYEKVKGELSIDIFFFYFHAYPRTTTELTPVL